jgi:hypothetical protein
MEMKKALLIGGFVVGGLLLAAFVVSFVAILQAAPPR